MEERKNEGGHVRLNCSSTEIHFRRWGERGLPHFDQCSPGPRGEAASPFQRKGRCRYDPGGEREPLFKQKKMMLSFEEKKERSWVRHCDEGGGKGGKDGSNRY